MADVSDVLEVHAASIFTAQKYIYCTVLAVLVGFTDYATQLFQYFVSDSTSRYYIHSLQADSDPLMSYVGAVSGCLLSSAASE
jgi:hypothetical protein